MIVVGMENEKSNGPLNPLLTVRNTARLYEGADNLDELTQFGLTIIRPQIYLD